MIVANISKRPQADTTAVTTKRRTATFADMNRAMQTF